MPFKIPKLWPPKPKKEEAAMQIMKNSGLPITEVNNIESLKTLGQGSYGVISICKLKNDGRQLIKKELMINDRDSEKLFIKEAKLLKAARHENVVGFHSVCFADKLSILMEYVYFDLKCVGQDSKLSSLKDFLSFVDDYSYENFEHFPKFIAEDVASGLEFLHSQGIVHRDLKPDNILISNQHYISYSETKQFEFWSRKPVVAKLTDFGECRSSLIQTSTLVHSRTRNVLRGTPVFMAPEIFLHDRSADIGLDEMKFMDVWSYAMVLYSLMSPDMKYPYLLEFHNDKARCSSTKDILLDIFRKQKLPQHSSKYGKLREIQWKRIVTVYHKCAKFSNRPSMAEVKSLLFQKER